MFKLGDIVRFIDDDDEWQIIGIGLESGKVAYCLIGYPFLVLGDKLKLVRPSSVNQAFTAGDKVQYIAHGVTHPETFTIDSVLIAYNTEREKDEPMYDLTGESGTEIYHVEQQYLQPIQTNYTLF